MKFIPSLAVLAVFVPYAASSQGLDCDNASDQATLNQCAVQDYKTSDAKLNATYGKLAKKVSKEGLEALKTAQRAWIAYRDAQCAFNTAGAQGASVNPMVYSLCLDELTQAQTKTLDAQLNCEEGDLSCGNQ